MRLEVFGGPEDGSKMDVKDSVAFHGYIGSFGGNTYAVLKEDEKSYPRLCFIREGRPNANRDDAAPTQSGS